MTYQIVHGLFTGHLCDIVGHNTPGTTLVRIAACGGLIADLNTTAVVAVSAVAA